MKHRIKHQTIGRSLTFGLTVASLGFAQDLTPPSAPIGLTATVASCGQVNLSWNASVDNSGGSGLKAYIIYRSDNINTAIGAVRTAFSDTNYVKSSTTLTYNVVAMDYAGNKSPASNSVSVTTPACPVSSSELIIDDSNLEPLGKRIPTYGSRTALIYTKQNAQLTLDTWLYVRDSDTSQTSRFLLHTSPSYRQIETEYVLTSATELWTLSFDPWGAGKVLVSQYRLNGSPIPTSATLLSTKSLGDTTSLAKSMMLLKSGALMVGWNQESQIKPDGSVDIGFAYRSPTGNWTIQFPLTIASTDTNNPRSQITMAQHPADGSIWAFSKRDMSDDMIAIHFTEAGGSIFLNWTNNSYISKAVDGSNGPQGEFPFLAAVADPFRNAILLAYQTNQYQFVFVDPLLNDMNSIFLKEATATIAQISGDRTKSFIPFPTYMERELQFGFSVLSDGSLWLTYQPINHQTLTMNQVYASKYSSNTWNAPVLVGYNYNSYDYADAYRDPGLLASRTDQPQVMFRNPDVKVHLFTLSDSPTPPADTTAPVTSITSPANGATVTGSVSISASASDNIGVAKVNFLIDGVVKGTSTSAPYTFTWNTSTATVGNHAIQAVAYDAAGNTGSSTIVTVSVTAAADTIAPTTSITSPANNAVVTGVVSIAASASDNIGVAKVDFLIDGTVKGTSTTAPYTFNWDTNTVASGNHTLKTVAYDAAGNAGSSAVITVAADNTPPSVAITTPSNGGTVPRNTTQTISVTAWDTVGVQKVEFYVDTKLTCTATAAPYNCSWKVPAKNNTIHTIKAVGYNRANLSASATNTVTAQ